MSKENGNTAGERAGRKEQCVEAIAAGLTGPRRHRGRSGKQAGADDPGGAVVAESPAVHRDAETCRRAFANAQRAARSRT